MPHRNRSATGLLLLALASLSLLVLSSAFALGALRTVRDLPEPGPWLAVKFAMFLVIAILAGQGLGRAIGSWLPTGDPGAEVSALERRVAELETRLRDDEPR